MPADYITHDAWKKMTWPQRIQLFADINGLTTRSAIAEKLGVGLPTVIGWFVGKHMPGSYLESLMRKNCVANLEEEKEAMWHTAMTSGFDCGEPYYRRALASGNTNGIAIAITVIAVKVIEALRNIGVPLDPTMFVFYRDSIYNSWPVWERITVTPVDPAARNITMRFVVSHTTGDSAEFALSGEVHVNGIPQAHFAGAITDSTLLDITKKAKRKFLQTLSTVTGNNAYGNHSRRGGQRARKRESRNLPQDKLNGRRDPQKVEHND